MADSSAEMNDAESPGEAIERGVEYQRNGNLEDAAATSSAVVDSGDAEFAPVAAELLGSLRLYAQDRPPDDEALYSVAIQSGNRKAMARALAGLAEVRHREGRDEEAWTLAERAGSFNCTKNSSTTSSATLRPWSSEMDRDQVLWPRAASGPDINDAEMSD